MWRAGLELQRLQHRLVVLVLVLQHHLVDVPISQEWIVRLEIDPFESRQYALADLGHRFDRPCERGQWQGAAHPAWMVERIVHPRHFDEFHLSVEVPIEPQLFEVSDVSEVPEDWTHQWIVLRT